MEKISGNHGYRPGLSIAICKPLPAWLVDPVERSSEVRPVDRPSRRVETTKNSTNSLVNITI